MLAGTEPGSIEVIEDGAPCHTSKETQAYRLQHSICRIPWPANSPDLNLIENVWSLLKLKLRKQWRNPNKRPHSRQERIACAQAAWEELPWEKIYQWFEGMPTRVLTVIRKGGRSTRW